MIGIGSASEYIQAGNVVYLRGWRYLLDGRSPWLGCPWLGCDVNICANRSYRSGDKMKIVCFVLLAFVALGLLGPIPWMLHFIMVRLLAAFGVICIAFLVLCWGSKTEGHRW